MSEIETGGAFLTAGLIASQLDTPGAARATAHDHGHCRNCNATLSGAYCSRCGQSSHVHRSLLHLIEELAHGLWHFDAKGWRTLPLLVARPGLLTRRYIEGQRVRYVSPLALFLFTVFLMFFVVSLTTSSPQVATRESLDKAIAEARQEVEKAQATLDRLQQQKAAAGAIDDAKEELSDAQSGLDAILATRAGIDAVASPSEPAASAQAAGGAAQAAAEAKHVPFSGMAAMFRRLSQKPWAGDHPRIAASLAHAGENPELMVYELKNTAYKYSFLLVPISLPFVWILFVFRRGVTAYDHCVFVLYSLSFMSLLMIVAALLGMLPGLHGLVALLFFVPPVHMALQLKETYRLGIFGTLWRTVALQVVAFLVLSMYLMLIVVLTMS